MSTDKSQVLQGALDGMILRLRYTPGPRHGLGIARRIEQSSQDVLALREPEP